MTLIELLKLNLLNARKATEPDETKTDLLTVLVSDCVKVGKDAGNRDTTDEECIKLIKSYVKACNTNIAIYEKSGAYSAQLSQALNEKSILESYLPMQLTTAQINTRIADYLAISGGDANFKGLMAYFKANYDGMYDGKTLSTLAKEIL